MWHIYISIVVLFRGAFCNPVIITAGYSNCTVEIKRFGEKVDTLEVKWNSDIYLICDASCVGPGPQPGLTWFYRDKNQSKDINIEELFRSSKFQTYPTTFHRKNELVIRDFGPNEETDFICKGAIYKEAKVALTGTDCLLKYNFRCKLGNKCIDRAYLCNQNNECPDGEDEVGCGKNMNTTTTLATTRIPEKGVVTENTSDESILPVTILSFRDGSESTSFSLLWRASQPTGIQIIGFRVQYSEVSIRPDRTPDGNYQVDKTIGPYRVVELPSGADRFTIVGLQPGRYYEAVVFAAESSKQSSQKSFIFKTADACPVNTFQCRQTNILECIDNKLHCDGTPDCTDGSDEEGCTCAKDFFRCNDGNCVPDRLRCDGIPQCEDGSDEIQCATVICLSDEFRCVNQRKCLSIAFRCNGILDCEDGSDEAECELPLICSEGKKVCKDLSKCIDDSQLCNGVQDCTDGGDEKDCGLDGAWSEWKDISHCYARSCNISCSIRKGRCDMGNMEQIRFCNNPSPGYGGKWCHGPVLRTVECENYVQPGWSEWGPVTCEKDCRESENVTVKGSKRRTCSHPPPIHEKDTCCGYGIQFAEDDSTICKGLPLCIYTTVSTTATSSTTKVTCPPKEGHEYYDGNAPNDNASQKDDNDQYDYSSCS